MASQIPDAVTDPDKKRRLFICKAIQTAQLCLGMMILLSLPMNNWLILEMETDGLPSKVELHIFSMTDRDDKEYSFPEMISDFSQPYSDIAKSLQALNILFFITWLLCGIFGVLALISKLYPFRWAFWKLEMTIWLTALTGNHIIATVKDELEMLQYATVENFTPTAGASTVPLWVTGFGYSVPGMVITSLTMWYTVQIMYEGKEYDAEAKGGRSSTLKNGETEEIGGINGNEPQKQGPDGPDLVGYAIVRDFDIDANTLFILSMTENFRSRFRSIVTVYLIQLLSFLVLVCQWTAISESAGENKNSLDFHGNSEHIWLRLLALVIIFFLLGQQFIQVVKRMIMVGGMDFKSFKGNGSNARAALRMGAALGILCVTMAVTSSMMQWAPALLLKIDDSEGTLGIIGDFTTYVVLIEIDNFAVAGVIEFVSVKDADVSIAMIEQIRDDFFEEIKDQETPIVAKARTIILRYGAFFYFFTVTISFYIFWFIQFSQEASVALTVQEEQFTRQVC